MLGCPRLDMVHRSLLFLFYWRRCHPLLPTEQAGLMSELWVSKILSTGAVVFATMHRGDYVAG